MGDRTPSLEEEARHLHACLFRKPISALIIERYKMGCAKEPPERRPQAGLPAPHTKVVALRLDAEAVEFALRRRGLGADLTRRMQILCYLVEVRPEYFSAFINAEPSRTRAWTALSWATLRSVWKWIKGEYLVRRYGLL